MSDDIICTSKYYCHGVPWNKQRFWTIFLSASNANLIIIVDSPSPKPCLKLRRPAFHRHASQEDVSGQGPCVFLARSANFHAKRKNRFVRIGHLVTTICSADRTCPLIFVKILKQTKSYNPSADCERAGPVQGSKSPQSGKEGFGVKKPPFPTNPEKANLSQKIPISPVVLCREMGIF